MNRLTLSALVCIALAGGVTRSQAEEEDWTRCNSRYDSRAACFTAIIQSGQRTPENLARAYIGRVVAGRDNDQYGYGEAIADIDQAIKLDQNNADAFRFRGGLEQDLGRYDQAIAYLDQAIMLDRKTAGASKRGGTSLPIESVEPLGKAEPSQLAPTLPEPLTKRRYTADDYPRTAIFARDEGVVIVRYIVLPSGKVGDCVVTIKSGFGILDDAGCRVVRGWKFKPATKNGQPVAYALGAEIDFWLRNLRR